MEDILDKISLLSKSERYMLEDPYYRDHFNSQFEMNLPSGRKSDLYCAKVTNHIRACFDFIEKPMKK